MNNYLYKQKRMTFAERQRENRVRENSMCGLDDKMDFRCCNSLRRKYFTLIELLMVVSIIMILVALLLPALSQVRKYGMAIKCASNQKNCIYGLSSYADDNSEYFPGAYTDIGTKSYGWTGVLVYAGFMQDVPVKSYSNIYFCPSGTYKDAATFGWNSRGTCSYGLNRGDSTFGKPSSDLNVYYHYRRLDIIRPEYRNMILGGDSIHTRDLFQPASLDSLSPTSVNRGVGIGGYRTLHFRHNQRANAFYPDGHVQSLSKENIVPETWITYAAVTNL